MYFPEWIEQTREQEGQNLFEIALKVDLAKVEIVCGQNLLSGIVSLSLVTSQIFCKLSKLSTLSKKPRWARKHRQRSPKPKLLPKMLKNNLLIKSVHFKKPVTWSSFLSKSVVIFNITTTNMTTIFERNEDRITGFLKWTDFRSMIMKHLYWVNLIGLEIFG